MTSTEQTDVIYINLVQWLSNFFKISTLRSPKIFFYYSRSLGMNLHTKSSEELEKRLSCPQMSNKAIYQKSTTSLRSP